MSQLRLGRKSDGTRHIMQLEPAYARVQGHGGAALGQAHTTFVVHQQRRAAAGTLTEAERLAHRRIPEKELLRGEALLQKRRYRARP